LWSGQWVLELHVWSPQRSYLTLSLPSCRQPTGLSDRFDGVHVRMERSRTHPLNLPLALCCGGNCELALIHVLVELHPLGRRKHRLAPRTYDGRSRQAHHHSHLWLESLTEPIDAFWPSRPSTTTPDGARPLSIHTLPPYTEQSPTSGLDRVLTGIDGWSFVVTVQHGSPDHTDRCSLCGCDDQVMGRPAVSPQGDALIVHQDQCSKPTTTPF
jgi:hypothetical protein